MQQVSLGVLAVLAFVSTTACAKTEPAGQQPIGTLQPEGVVKAIEAVDDARCLAYGFRGWSVERVGDVLTVRGEAHMPTPAWTLHLAPVNVGDDTQVAFEFRAKRPTGMTAQVLSWTRFEGSAPALSADAPVVVTCAGETVWPESRSDAAE